MPIKISPFNAHTVQKYGMKKIQELDLEHRSRREPEEAAEVAVEEQVTEAVALAGEFGLDRLIGERGVEREDEVVEDEVVEDEVVEDEVVQDEVVEAEEEVVEAEEEVVEIDDLADLEADELRDLAKSLGVSHWWTKGEERLRLEIVELQN